MLYLKSTAAGPSQLCDMTSVTVALGWSCTALLALGAMIALMRWARRGGRGTALLGSALVLLLGIGLVPEQIPEQRIEEAREEKGKKGAESGDPPA
jgi:hypothetical protein